LTTHRSDSVICCLIVVFAVVCRVTVMVVVVCYSFEI
jgi:hypothetical protein